MVNPHVGTRVIFVDHSWRHKSEEHYITHVWHRPMTRILLMWAVQTA